MADESFVDVLKKWVGNEVTVVNPESYKSTALGEGLTFQSYPAMFSEVGPDFVKMTFTAKKKDEQTSVEQIIPLEKIKRISIWGDQKLIHL